MHTPPLLAEIEDPVFLSGDSTTAHRDPALHYHDGVFRVFHSVVTRDECGCYWDTSVTRSRDLVHWSEPEPITERSLELNYSSPGNVIYFGGKWLLCLQTYPTPNGERFGTDDARVFIVASEDLDRWEEPRIMRVKGPDVAIQDMGRMIDPYLLEDKDEPGRWWCFYKQHGASRSYTYDFDTWYYAGHFECGENVCALVQDNEYVLFHSPENGVGIERSRDLERWYGCGLLTFDQSRWPWARGRLTAGHVVDLRGIEGVGCYLMVFHGSSEAGVHDQETHGHSSLAFAWSEDLVNWSWPGKDR